MKTPLRFCLGFKIVSEVILLILALTQDLPHGMTSDQAKLQMVMVGAVFVGQLFLYRYISSSWPKMSGVKKLFLVLLFVAPSWIVVGLAQAALLIIVVLLVIIAFFAFGGPRAERNYRQQMRDAETRGNIEQIRYKLDDINSKLE